MDFIWAGIYPFRGRHWDRHLLLLSLMLLIPFAGYVVGCGYIIAIVRSITQDDYNLPRPSLRSSGGMEALGSLFLHSFAAGLLSAYWVFLLGNPRTLETIHLIGLFAIAAVSTVHFVTGLIHYALTDNVDAMFEYSQNLRIVYHNRWRFAYTILQALVFKAVFTGLLLLVFNIPGDGPQVLIAASLLINVWLTITICGLGYLLGQLACRLDLSEVKAKRKNNEISSSQV